MRIYSSFTTVYRVVIPEEHMRKNAGGNGCRINGSFGIIYNIASLCLVYFYFLGFDWHRYICMQSWILTNTISSIYYVYNIDDYGCHENSYYSYSSFVNQKKTIAVL